MDSHDASAPPMDTRSSRASELMSDTPLLLILERGRLVTLLASPNTLPVRENAPVDAPPRTWVCNARDVGLKSSGPLSMP